MLGQDDVLLDVHEVVHAHVPQLTKLLAQLLTHSLEEVGNLAGGEEGMKWRSRW